MSLKAYFACSTLAIILATASGASAETESGLTPSFGITAVSDYRFRGVSLTDKRPAVQGTVSISHENGLYAGVFATNIAENGGADIELDISVGYAVTWNDLGVDASLNRYGYPGTVGADYYEAIARFERPVGDISVGLSAGYVPRQENTGDEDNIYLAVDASRRISRTPVKLIGSIGWEDGAFGDNKIDWMLGAEVEARKATVGLSYIGASQALGGTDAGLLFSVGMAF
jgi:uncharacterized protein (TIGR02001 family)